MAEALVLSERPKQTAVLRRAWPFLKPHKVILALAIMLSVAATLAMTLFPSVIGWAVNRVEQRDLTGLYAAAGTFAALVVARMVLLRSAELWLARAGERVVASLRDLAVTRLAEAPLRFLEAQRSGDLLRRSTAEIADLASFVRSDLPDLLSVSGYLIFTTVMLLFYSWQLTLVLVFVFLPLAVLTMRWFQRGARVAFAAEAAEKASIAATYREGVQARELLVSRGAQQEWRQRFDRDAGRLRRATLVSEFVVLRTSGVTVAQAVADATILVLGGGLVLAWGMPLSTVAVFVLAMRQLFDSTNQLTSLIGQLQTSRVGLARLLDLLDTTARPKIGSNGVSVPPRGALEASSLHFSYVDGLSVLTDVSCAFPPGSRSALVGPTGSGKTTLAKILAGLYTADGGSVRYCGVPLEQIGPEQLRSRIMLIPQRVHVVTGTLRDNLRLVPSPPTDDRIDWALGELGLREWVQGLPEQLDTPVSATGDTLSAGERQLIGLVRAALVDPAVLILDEATADVDPVTGDRIERALDRLHADRSLIVIAHRQSTIDRLPHAVRLEAGRTKVSS
ncbi:ABC-type multidrug transport system fused ATPase/permease subunit [Kutzneria viridogrisea]|uniref:ABC-type multidrug transport system fused ATPase/permease subunit n=1 Tax=Kutzneria viridogrisea TaxID=47990 RepID=A0ABR6BB90_9PSEU|nr:ABC transporter ATP-binding protein [Kutzneria albida]MBA8924137.1 ABC-type multidrug transport system fused ATPase/permease subunit [Kutzneria viridogrisea]